MSNFRDFLTIFLNLYEKIKCFTDNETTVIDTEAKKTAQRITKTQKNTDNKTAFAY